MTTPRPPKNLMCLILHKRDCVFFGCFTCKEQDISEFVSYEEQPVSCDVFSVTGSTHLLAPWEEMVKILCPVSHLSSTTWTLHGAPLSESSCRGTPILCTLQWRPLSGTWGDNKMKPQDFAWTRPKPPYGRQGLAGCWGKGNIFFFDKQFSIFEWTN